MEIYLLVAKSLSLQLLLPVSFCFVVAIVAGYYTAIVVLGKRYSARSIGLCNMFAFYGLVLGYLVGVSQESMARDAFSGVVTILSGYFGFVISKDLHSRLKAMIPVAVTCFLITLLFSMIYFNKVHLATKLN